MFGHKQVRLVSILMLMVIVLAACAQGAAPTTAPEATAPPEEMGRPLPADAAADQTLNYVYRGFGFMNPAREGGGNRFVISHIWMPFFIRDENHQLSPWLATGYDVNDDGTVYTIHIDPRAVWSDGSPVVAQDAIDYWEYGLDRRECVGCYLAVFSTGFTNIVGGQAIADGESTELTGAVALDDKTLQLTLVGADPIFIDNLALFNSGFPKMEDVLADDSEGHHLFAAAGTARANGPFMIEKWDPDTQEYIIVQNPNWWGDEKPYIEKIIGQNAADENVSYIMWQNDEIDIVFWLSNIREQVRDETPEVFVQIPYATNFYYQLRGANAPLEDLNLRRALIHAVDWTAAITAAWEGARNERVMTSIMTPELTCYKEGNWPDFGYDPELAREELAASSYTAEDMPLLRITPNGQSPNYIRTAEIMIEQWKENLGITNVEIRPGGPDAWGQDAEQIQVYRLSAGAILPDELSLLASHYNWFSDPEVGNYEDAVAEALLAELAVTARDAPGYCEKVQQLEAQLLSHYYFMPMIWDLYEYEVKPWVANFRTNVDNNWAGLLDMYIVEH